jgi:hypothetical protein
MKDPVVLESGQAYEKEMIDHYFSVSGPIEPITK